MTNRGKVDLNLKDAEFLLVDDAGLYAFDTSSLYKEDSLGRRTPIQIGELERGETLLDG